jgi:hypothetical protein
MDTVIVDARQWQKTFDLRTGENTDGDGAISRMVRGVLARRPYPGDMAPAADRWVTDTALDLAAVWKPRLVCLSYARPYFAQRVMPFSGEEARKTILEAFEEAGRFVAESGYAPVFVGTGDMVELRGEMDLSMLDAVVSSGSGYGRYVGLHRPSERDLAHVASLPGVERLVCRDEWLGLFSGADHDPADIPDRLLVCREGWTVRSVGSSPRRTVRVQGHNPVIPVSTPLGAVSSITGIRALIEENLPRRPIALIVIEGVGTSHFPLPFTECANGLGWYCYEPGEGQYLTITNGEHQVFAYPPGYRFSHEAMEQTIFPFSGHFREVPSHTLGADFEGPSLAVGNRSMFTHMVFGADISVECFARNLFNQGCIAVLKERIAAEESAFLPDTRVA